MVEQSLSLSLSLSLWKRRKKEKDAKGRKKEAGERIWNEKPGRLSRLDLLLLERWNAAVRGQLIYDLCETPQLSRNNRPR